MAYNQLSGMDLCDETSKLTENKLIILYLVSRTGIAALTARYASLCLKKDNGLFQRSAIYFGAYGGRVLKHGQRTLIPREVYLNRQGA